MDREASTVDVERPSFTAAGQAEAIALLPIPTHDARLEYCLTLAHNNMNPYLAQRGEEFDDVRWRVESPRAEFFLIRDAGGQAFTTVGFVGVRLEADSPCALHLGDIQIEATHRNRGIGLAVLRLIESMARARGLTELTLNVFRDNPALRLYERFGFRRIDTQLYKYKMRKSLRS
jgi:ribosomal protein S18 acetylase RimI-like enzyme